MVDEIDKIQEITQLETDALIRNAAKPIPEGLPGVCKDCKVVSKRIVAGRCARCRDALRS